MTREQCVICNKSIYTPTEWKHIMFMGAQSIIINKDFHLESNDN